MSAIGKLYYVMILYIAIGLSAGCGSMASAIIHSKKGYRDEKKNIPINFLCTLVGIMVLGLSGIIFTGMKIEDDYLNILIIFSLLSISSAQIAESITMRKLRNQTPQKDILFYLKSAFLGFVLYFIIGYVLFVGSMILTH
jgi:hypothetical protein